MDEVVIELRTRTDRPGKEPICTAEKVSLSPAQIALLKIRGCYGEEAVTAVIVALFERAQRCVRYGKSAGEFTSEDEFTLLAIAEGLLPDA
jgi:hypothetical protein